MDLLTQMHGRPYHHVFIAWTHSQNATNTNRVRRLTHNVDET